MLRKTVAASLMTLVLVTPGVIPALAQDATPEATPEMTMPVPANAIVSGLNSPAGISYDADGNLLIAIGGTGGDKLLSHSAEDGDTYVGLTGQVIQVAPDGKQSVVIDNLGSGGSAEGASASERAYAQGSSIWLVYGGDGGNTVIYTDAVIEVDKATRRIKNFIDLYTIEATQNPDGNEINSNPFNLTWGPDGLLYVIDAGANTIYTWTKADGLKVFHTWPDNSVPTAMSFAGNGEIYISFLGSGIAPGAGHIEHWSADGKTLIDTFDKLNAVMDVAVGKDGGVYAVQLAQFGEQGPVPESGSVIKVDKTGATIIADKLNAPFALAQAPDGSWAVSVNAVFSPPGSGAVVKVGGSATAAATSEANAVGLVGAWTTTVTKEDLLRVVPDFPKDFQCDNAGTFVWNFKADGTFTIDQTPLDGCSAPAQAHVTSTWSSEGDTVTFAKGGPDQEVYQWAVADNQLTLTYQSGDCVPCKATNTANPWKRSI